MKRLLLKSCMALAIMLIGATAFAQTRTVSGTVTDSAGEPVPGVAVMVRGNNSIGTSTDTNGRYTLPNVPNGATLVFSFIGMDTQEIAVGNSSTINAVMNESSEMLDEMVVIGYGSIKKADLTGAVSVIETSDYKNKANNSIADALQGLAAGVNVRSSGGLGDLPTVLIRGTSSLTNNTPLYIIDGIPTSNNIGFNVDDIDSIQILKDASAAAIYGSRAANGVIIITTKQGKAGKVDISFSNQTSVQWNKRDNYADHDEAVALLTQTYEDGRATGSSRAATPNFWTHNTDWQDAYYKTGIQQKYDLSISGGSQDARFRVSYGHMANSGAQIGRSMRRETASITSSFTKGIVTFGQSLQFGLTNNKSHSNSGLNNVVGMSPLVPIHDDVYGKRGWGIGNNTGNPAYTTAYNVVATCDDSNGYSLSEAMYIRASAWGEIKLPIDGLKYKLNLGANINDSHSRSWETGTQFALNFTDVASNASASASRSTTYLVENTLNYDKILGQHNINAVLGQSYQDTFSSSVGSARQQLVQTAGGFYLKNVSSGLVLSGSTGSTNQSRLISYFGRVNYSYASKYLFQATVRADGSSRFAPGNKWGFFPSMSVGWRVSQEDFWNVSWMNDFKIRYSYGRLGSQNVGNYDWMSLINSYTSYNYSGGLAPTAGQAIVELSNRDISWETLIQHNAGIDMAFLNNQLLVTLEYYVSKSKDCLYNQEILRVNGATNNPVVNSATLSNRGIELQLQWRQNVNRDFSYRIGANFSHNENRLDGLGYGVTNYYTTNTWSEVGHPLGLFYLVVADGLFQTDEEATASGLRNAKAGDINFQDINKDGRINTSDRQAIYDKSPWPGLEASLNIMAEYKNWSLQISGFGEFFKYTLNGYRSTVDGRSANTIHQLRSGLNWWTTENQHNDIWYPRARQGYTYNDIAYTTRFLERGDFFKFNSISLGYNWLPKGAIGTVIKSLTASVTAQNMLTLTKFSGLDPDFKGGIFTPGNYGTGVSNPYTIIFGLNMTF